FGASGSGGSITVKVSDLSVDTSRGGGNQFIVSSFDNFLLSGLDLDAGNGDITLNVASGPVFDSDTDIDITADSANIRTGNGFGVSGEPISTNVNSLDIADGTSSAGNVIVTQSKSLSKLHLVADIAFLTMTAGSISHFGSASSKDIVADSATI